MSEAKDEEMSVPLPPSLPASAHAQTGRVWNQVGGRCQRLPGEGRKVPAVK